MKGHSKEVMLASQLNNEADYYASKSQNVASSIHPAPTPTFYMDKYMFYCPTDGSIESHIHIFIEYFLVKATTDDLAIGHQGQVIDFHQQGWDHIIRQVCLQVSVYVRFTGSTGAYYIANQ